MDHILKKMIKLELFFILIYATVTSSIQNMGDFNPSQFNQKMALISEEVYDPDLNRNDFDKKEHPIACYTCKFAIESAIKFTRAYSKFNFTTEASDSMNPILSNAIISGCSLFQPYEICKGYVNLNFNTLAYIATKKNSVTGSRICSIVLQYLGCKDLSRSNWKVKLPEKPYLIKNLFVRISRTIASQNMLQLPIKVLHLSDIHHDSEYSVGSNAVCNQPLCCRAGSTPRRPEDAAGKWGDLRSCDTPWHVLENSLDHITAQHDDISFVYYTGDVVDHKSWNTSLERNSKIITKVMKKLKETFGSIPVYPVLGNHEPHPVDLFAPAKVMDLNYSTQWIFELAVELWKDWLPAETRKTILLGGYYTVLVKPGLRVIALNSNVCYILNFWLIYNDVDPYGQLQWLVKVLTLAERNNEVVHILSHIPAGDFSCLNSWGRELTKILNRFSHIVAAQFNGHTHKLGFTIHFKSNDFSNPGHVAFNGGSLTSWSENNPNYIVYEVDRNTFEVLDYQTWMYNITEANLTPEQSPKWYKLYSFKEAYQMNSSNPYEMVKLVKRLAKNKKLANQFIRFKSRGGEPEAKCGKKCIINSICTTVTSYYGDSKHCDIIKNLMKS